MFTWSLFLTNKIHYIIFFNQVVLPPNFEYVPLKAPVGPPAKEYKFNLDPFQREAISCLQNNQSVLVSAHTSAGKTVVAEYVKHFFLKFNI